MSKKDKKDVCKYTSIDFIFMYKKKKKQKKKQNQNRFLTHTEIFRLGIWFHMFEDHMLYVGSFV